MYNKDGSLDKRFKENKGLENYNLSSAYSELAKAEKELERIELEKKQIEKTINNFLKLSNNREIVNEISDLTDYFMVYSDIEERFGEEKQNLIWFDENTNFKKMIFPDNFQRIVVDSYFCGGIEWDGIEYEKNKHSVFIKKFNRLEHLIDELTAVEQSSILEIKKIADEKAKKQQEKKPRIIENFGYCYNYDSNPLDETEFKKIKAKHDTFKDFLLYRTRDIYNDNDYNFCLKHLTNNELSILEKYNSGIIETDCELMNDIINEDNDDTVFFSDDELNESIILEKQRRGRSNNGGFIKNIISSIFKK